MIFNKDNYFEAMSKYTFEEELIQSSIIMLMENYEPSHFFVYEEYFDGELDSVDVTFCNNKSLYNIYLIVDLDGVVIDFDMSYHINAKILEEKF